MLNLEQRDGYKNRHTDKLPTEHVVIKIIVADVGGETEHLCQWFPFQPENYVARLLPAAGYLGTARDLSRVIGFHAWEQNNEEFIYYKLV